MTWRTRRVSWSQHSELVEFLHPGQENVHFSKGFGLGCLYVQLKRKECWRSTILAARIGFLATYHSWSWLYHLWDGLWWAYPPITCCFTGAGEEVRTKGQWVAVGKGTREKHLEFLIARTIESLCGVDFATSWVYYADEETEVQLASFLCILFTIYF